MKLFRQVKCSERLPEKWGMYICIIKVKIDGLHYKPATYCQWDSISSEWTNPNFDGIKGEVVTWYEPVEIPTDEEIECMRYEKYGTDQFLYAAQRDGYEEGFKAAINHLIGGK